MGEDYRTALLCSIMASAFSGKQFDINDFMYFAPKDLTIETLKELGVTTIEQLKNLTDEDIKNSGLRIKTDEAMKEKLITRSRFKK